MSFARCLSSATSSSLRSCLFKAPSFSSNNNLKFLLKNDLLNNSINATRTFHLSSIDFDTMILKMPSLSPTMTEGTIVKWHKKEGDKFSPGDTIFEVQTDKAVIPFELEEEGIIAKILNDGTSGAPIKVGQLVALMVGPGEDWKNVKVPEGAASSSQQPQQQEQKEAPKSDAASQQSSASSAGDPHFHLDYDKKLGPAARMLMQSYQIDPKSIKSTGPHGLIMKSDVQNYIREHNLSPKKVEASSSEPAQQQQQQQQQPSQAPSGGKKSTTKKPTDSPDREPVEYEDIELSNMRRTIAKRLLLSKTTIPHSYVTVNCQVDKVIELRKEFIKNNQKVSINDFIIKALALALRMVPEMNANDSGNGQYTQIPTVDISVAVATDKGLITPIVKNADRLSVVAISERVKLLADKARQGKLQPHEFQGGTFSLSNLGMFGIKEFSAVINPPQAGIMAVGTTQKRFAAADEEEQAVAGGAAVVKKRQVQSDMAFTLSFDERCVDLDRAMKFMNTVNYFLTNPNLLVDKLQD